VGGIVNRTAHWRGNGQKDLKVARKQFERIAKDLLQSKPVKRGNVKVSKRKPEKLIPPQK